MFAQFKAVVGKLAQILPDIPLTILRLVCDRVKGNLNSKSQGKPPAEILSERASGE
jgi:hypothetical protein